MNKYWERIYNGVVKENPILILMLGMCPTLAVSTQAMNGIGMGPTSSFLLLNFDIVQSISENDHLEERHHLRFFCNSNCKRYFYIHMRL